MLLIWLFLVVLPPNEPELLRQSRELFFNFNQEKCSAEKLFDLLQKSPDDNAVLMAYKGTARASSADCTFLPHNKLQRFNQGKKLLNNAITLDSANAEIRFLRLSVQVNAPGFLAYNSNINEDKQLLLTALFQNQMIGNDTRFTLQVIAFLQQNLNLEAKESEMLKQLTLKLKN
ncbi:MAG: hypothetical protein KJ578_14750 [Bacteroidetes bacterium]|nr:hypothetical protein [Bacteroidota bacterium]MBU1578505.1 hypothetical protein [Bacteroidota bacterium]MBU2465398.1 hypothetical protein [Bacteroidota bacterium]MBU2559035.1 hypothetical protein [Bacteroidota bacterium]